jgi:hypothetical protein
MSRFADDYRAARAHKLTQCAENRALVLRYPDLAARLKEPPFSASDPAKWTGYIPGPLAAENARGIVALNTSPVRTQLLELVMAAAERDENEGGTRT